MIMLVLTFVCFFNFLLKIFKSFKIFNISVAKKAVYSNAQISSDHHDQHHDHDQDGENLQQVLSIVRLWDEVVDELGEET